MMTRFSPLCVLEINVLSQLSITLTCVNMKKSFPQPNLENENIFKTKKHLAVIFLCSFLLTMIFALPLPTELPLQ